MPTRGARGPLSAESRGAERAGDSGEEEGEAERLLIGVAEESEGEEAGEELGEGQDGGVGVEARRERGVGAWGAGDGVDAEGMPGGRGGGWPSVSAFPAMSGSAPVVRCGGGER